VLAVRVLGHELLELPDHWAVKSDGQVGVDARLDRPEHPLLDQGRLRHGPRLEREIGERSTTNEAESLGEEPGSALGLGVGRLRHEAVESVDVDLVRADDDLVAALVRQDALVPESAPEVRDVHLHALERGRRRIVGPERVDELVGRHALPPAEKQDGEQRPLLGGGEVDRPTTLFDLQRAEQAELHPPTLTGAARRG
jgi:hypothetical protein